MLHSEEKLCSLFLILSHHDPSSFHVRLASSLNTQGALTVPVTKTVKFVLYELSQHLEIFFPQISTHTTATSSHKTGAWTSLAGPQLPAFPEWMCFFVAIIWWTCHQLKPPKEPIIKNTYILLSPPKDTLEWVKYRTFLEPGNWETEGKSLKVCCDRQPALARGTARLLPHFLLRE